MAFTIGSTTRQASLYYTLGRHVLFQYVVQADAADADGVSMGANALTLNGGTIRTKGGTADAMLDLGDHAIDSSEHHKVDGSRETAPRVFFVQIVSSPEGGDYSAGAEIVVRVAFDRAVDVAGAPQLALTIGAATRQASYVEHLEAGFVA